MRKRLVAVMVLWGALAVVLVACGSKREGRAAGPGAMTSMASVRAMGQMGPRPASSQKPPFAWPRGYVQQKVVRLTAARVSQIGRNLGGELVAVTNYHLQRGAERLQVNLIEARTEVAAKRVHARLAGQSFQGRGRYARRGRLVVELFGGRPRRWHDFMRASKLLDRSPRKYRLRARYGLLQQGNAADVNLLFNLALKPRPADAKWKAQWDKLRGSMRFGNTLRLRLAPTAAGMPRYRLTPQPAKSLSAGARRELVFTEVKKLHGIPYVDLVAEVETQGWTPIVTSRPVGRHLTTASPQWPTQATAVQALVKKLTHAGQSASARLAVLHGWVNRNIRHAGRQGSRDGTLAVLKRGFGRCGDSADVMITLARAAGLPARLVAGWIVGGPGHFWAEVHVAGRGWVSVDATAPWLGVSGEYIPLMISETGPLPLMHLRMPSIERLK